MLARDLSLQDLQRVCEIDEACYGGKGLWSKGSYEADILSASADTVGLFLCGSEGVEDAQLVGFGCMSVVLDEASVTNVAVRRRPRTAKACPAIRTRTRP